MIYKHIQIDEENLNELLEVLRLRQKKFLGGAQVIKAILFYFEKHYDVTTEYSHGFIDGDKCLIIDRDSGRTVVTAKEIKDQLIRSEYLVPERIHVEHKDGTKQWRDDEKTIPIMGTVYQLVGHKELGGMNITYKK